MGRRQSSVPAELRDAAALGGQGRATAELRAARVRSGRAGGAEGEGRQGVTGAAPDERREQSGQQDMPTRHMRVAHPRGHENSDPNRRRGRYDRDVCVRRGIVGLTRGRCLSEGVGPAGFAPHVVVVNRLRIRVLRLEWMRFFD